MVKIKAQAKTLEKVSDRKQNTNPTIQKSKVETSKPLVMGEYECSRQFTARPITESFLESMSQNLMQWAQETESIHLVDWFHESGMPSDTFYEWTNKSPSLKRAHRFAMEALGARRESGAITKKYDTGAVWKRQYQFGNDYKEAMEFTAKLAKKEDLEDGGGKTFIIMGDMKSDPSMEKYFKTEAEKKKE